MVGKVNVDVAVLGKTGVDGYTQQAALAAGGDIAYRKQRLGLQLSVGVNIPYPAGALGQDYAAIGQEVQRPGYFQVANQ
jgi:hypothetical protein